MLTYIRQVYLCIYRNLCIDKVNHLKNCGRHLAHSDSPSAALKQKRQKPTAFEVWESQGSLIVMKWQMNQNYLCFVHRDIRSPNFQNIMWLKTSASYSWKILLINFIFDCPPPFSQLGTIILGVSFDTVGSGIKMAELLVVIKDSIFWWYSMWIELGKETRYTKIPQRKQWVSWLAHLPHIDSQWIKDVLH